MADKKITDKTIREAYMQAARIVAEHGEAYLPIFERLEQEHNDRQKNAALLKRALRLAKAEPI